MKIIIHFLSLLLLTLSACSTAQKSTRQPADTGNYNERARTSLEKSSDEVAVYLENQQVKYIQSPTRKFNINTVNSRANIDKLTTYIDSYKTLLQLNADTKLQLKTQSVHRRSSKTYVRFQQVIERQVNKKQYLIPIASSGVVAVIQNGKLESLNSSLKNPPNINLIFDHPGLNTSGFTSKQLQVLLKHVVNSPNKNLIKSYFANVAQNSNLNFDFEEFLKMTTDRQLKALRVFFGSIKAVSTAKIIIELAQKERLSLVKYGNEWMFQITQFFDLPIQFDIAIPGTADKGKQLRLKNMRELFQTISIEVFSQNDYPGGANELRVTASDASPEQKLTPSAQESDKETTQLFQNISQYFKTQHNWIGYNGTDNSTVVTVLKDITSSMWTENAFWYGAFNHFGIGSGGATLMNFHRSPSTIGHEFGHAIVDKTSGLVYQGQSGALNEHFADLQGINFESHLLGQPYDYTIGEDLVNPTLIPSKKEIIDFTLKSHKVSQEEIQKFSLNEVALRNMYDPSVSLFAQLTHYDQFVSQYGNGCQPSVDNDSCGVHYASGIPNKASSLIISELGAERTRHLFFNTGTLRLGSNATFQEYLRQLYEECVTSNNFSKESECPIIVSAFDAVGVSYPTDPNPPPQTEPIPNEPDNKPPPAPPGPPTSDFLTFCGWKSLSKSQNITIIDNKFDSVIIPAANKDKFAGNHTQIAAADLALAKKMECGCVTGTISQTQNSKGTWFNFFNQIQQGSVKAKNKSACAGIEFK